MMNGIDNSDRSILILYGSETGNAQDCAEILAKKCQRLRLEPRVSSMDDYQPPSSLSSESVVIIICSTTGQGDLPRNAQKFWKFLLRRKLPNTYLSNVKFTSFGLGDSSYPRYNWAIRKIHKRLLQLGAQEFLGRGEGDEMSTDGIENQFEAWQGLVSEKLVAANSNTDDQHRQSLFTLPEGMEIMSDDELLEPRYKLNIEFGKLKTLSNKIALSRPDALIGVVKSNERITAKDHFQDVRHFVFETESSPQNSLHYYPGDTVGLYPQNDPDDVEALINHQQWSDIADFPITVNEEFERAVVGGLVKPLTLRSLITHHLDISSIPRRSFFSLAWHFSQNNEREQERLKEFSTLEGLQDLYDYANRSRRSILETITEFHSLQIPVNYILELIPILRPRLFSIASPANDSDNDSGIVSFSLAIAIVKYKTIIKRIRRGVCTKWVEELSPGDKIPFSLFRASFKSEEVHDIDTPIIMIAPGTGVAPMRSLILTRASKTINGGPVTPMTLFFGCRYQDKDYIFHDDWEKVKSSSLSLEVIPAFSRQQNGGGYVQDKLYAFKEKVGDLIVNHNASIYVCGSAGKMPRQVRITISTILEESQRWDPATAESYVQSLEKTGRYLQETW